MLHAEWPQVSRRKIGVTEYPELEGAHIDHQSPTPGPAQVLHIQNVQEISRGRIG